MFREFWPPSMGLQHHGEESQPQQQPIAAVGSQDRQPRRSPFAVITRPMRFLGRGVGATASGMSTVVQTPVRAARGLRQRDTAPAAPPQPEPEPEPARKRTAWDG